MVLTGSLTNYWQDGSWPTTTRLSMVYTLVTLFTALSYAVSQSISFDLDTILVNFWCNDLNGMNDAMRVLYYTGLFLISYTSKYARPHLGDSPLQAYELFSYTDTAWYSLEGCMKYTVFHLFTYRSVLAKLNMLTYFTWACCILGFMGHTPPVLLGMLLLVQHGIVSGCIGTSHRWYVPVYSTLALMFSDGRHEYSLDGLFSQYINDYMFPVSNEPSLLNSGFSRKLILFSGIYTLFGGGISKLLNSGVQWCNTECLAYYVSSTENGQLTWLKNFMYNNPLLTCIMAVQSELFELASILSLFGIGRLPILLMAAILHFGIWLTMWPNYAPQTFCYIFGINHTWSTYDNQHIIVDATASTIVASLFMTYMCIFLSCVILLRIEFWPLSGIPMYSLPRDKSFNYKYIKDKAQADYLANEYRLLGYPNTLAWSNQWVILSITNNKQSIDLRDYISNTNNRYGVLGKQFRRQLHNAAANILIDKMRLKSQSQYGKQWLDIRLDSLHMLLKQNKLPDWVNKSDNILQLYMPLQNGQKLMLAETPWNENKKKS